MATEYGIRKTEFVTFRVGAQEFGIDIMSVREIRGWTPATPVPHAPPETIGVVNLRGVILPIIDLAVFMGFPAPEPTPRHVIIVVALAKQTVGLMVDAVADIVSLGDDEIQPTPEIIGGSHAAIVRGVAALSGRMIGILAPGLIFRSDDRDAA